MTLENRFLPIAVLSLLLQSCNSLPPNSGTGGYTMPSPGIIVYQLNGTRHDVPRLSEVAAEIPKLELRLAGKNGLSMQGLKAIKSITDADGLGLAALLEQQRDAAYSQGADKTVKLSARRVKGDIEAVMRAAQFGGFAELADEIAKDKEAKALGKYSHFLAVYLDAYFRKFGFINAKLKLDDAKTRLSDGLESAFHKDGDLSDKEKAYLRETAGKLMDTICPDEKKCQFLKADEEGSFFYNRSGQKFGFPTISITFQPGATKTVDVTKIDEVALIGDITRVTIEALADAATPRVCAHAKSTGCKEKLFEHCISEADTVRFKRLQEITKVADTTEAAAAFVAAQAVRGGWFGSLNNEALAQLLQTTASVTARKIAEEIESGPCTARATTKPAFTISRVTIQVVE